MGIGQRPERPASERPRGRVRNRGFPASHGVDRARRVADLVRPEQPAIFQELRGQVERYLERQIVLPGITGWAQFNHSHDQSFDDVGRKVELDPEYIRRRSPVEDLRIMVRTLPVMVGRKGAF
jgi:hypothetical protein